MNLELECNQLNEWEVSTVVNMLLTFRGDRS